ncbi:MAG TPA: YvcK family protein [Pseudogracilibacillus sp.]|nr:YvcK family protein [Pseudogracilibacillus sp.]
MVNHTQEAKVVVMGGGTGMPAVLRGLKHLPIDITTIVTVADDGGSTGTIRENVDMPAPGDVRNVIASMSTIDTYLNELFQYRFDGMEGLSGHSLGNLALLAMRNITGDFAIAIDKVAEIFQVKGKVLPVVNASVTLHAETTDGEIISGESKITGSNHSKIERVYITPNHIQAYPLAIKAIHEADLIIISPGSLYTSILPNLIVPGIAEAMKQSYAKVMYVCNMMTQHGETDGYDVADHVHAINQHVEKEIIDTVVVHNEPFNDEILQHYAEELAEPVQLNYQGLELLNIEVIEENLLVQDRALIRHDERKLAKLIQKVIGKLNSSNVMK